MLGAHEEAAPQPGAAFFCNQLGFNALPSESANCPNLPASPIQTPVLQ
jgi:hypothetical protein